MTLSVTVSAVRVQDSILKASTGLLIPAIFPFSTTFGKRTLAFEL